MRYPALRHGSLSARPLHGGSRTFHLPPFSCTPSLPILLTPTALPKFRSMRTQPPSSLHPLFLKHCLGCGLAETGCLFNHLCLSNSSSQVQSHHRNPGSLVPRGSLKPLVSPSGCVEEYPVALALGPGCSDLPPTIGAFRLARTFLQLEAQSSLDDLLCTPT